MSTQRGNVRRSRAGLLRHGKRALTTGAALTAALTAIGAPAHATTNVSVSGGQLTVHAGTASDDITVTLSEGRIIVKNTGDTVVGSAPCTRVTANEVACPSKGITMLSATTGAGDDVLRNETGLQQKANLAPGNDTLISGRGVIINKGGNFSGWDVDLDWW
ncbi:hypothetical protein ETD86_21765 [Nonomuraea turkmeniaca]|uniref:DUF3060 domain-containing protein n=1 Tax=Nonomuraea turkmeniaca TaxID=103838 RepID=A0A5S4FFY8_9ACTN|nr:hypothetical protein [Nonomuraea turkmeniaca]TMR18341.1 hypothetical protein ETD86_21765 [Nonomuraea turkmeniaca]